MDTTSRLTALNERLTLALESSRQVAFDWHIPSDELFFTGGFSKMFRSPLFEADKVWSSSDLPKFIHEDDLAHFQACLHTALKETKRHEPHKIRLRLKGVRDWRWIEIGGRIVERDSNGRAVRMTGTFADVDAENWPESTHYQQRVIHASEAMFICQDEKLILVNQAGCDLLGSRRPDKLLGRSLLDFIHIDYRTTVRELLNPRSFDAAPTAFIEQLWHRLDGSHFHAEICTTPLTYNGAPATQVVARDVSERKRAEALQLGQNRILNMIAAGDPLRDILGEIALLAESLSNHALCSILQLNADGTKFVERTAPSLPPTSVPLPEDEKIGPCHRSCGTAVFRAEPVMVTDITLDVLWTDQYRPALEHGLKACTSWPIFSKKRDILGTFSLYFREATLPGMADIQLFHTCTYLAGLAIESRAAEQEIRYLAHYDGLTALPNRFLFKEYLDLALRNAQRHGNRFAVLFLDLDQFKQINDTLGHDIGDRVLQEIAYRMRSCIRDTDKIARMGGDEFYVLIEELKEGRHAIEVAQKLLAAAARPIQVGSEVCHLGLSIGISVFPDDGETTQMLLKNADSAMYRAKDAGKNTYRFYSAPEKCYGPRTLIPRRARLGHCDDNIKMKNTHPAPGHSTRFFAEEVQTK